MNRVGLGPSWIGFGLLGLIGALALGIAAAGVSEVTSAKSARFTTVVGTLESYDYLRNCHPRVCFIYDVLQPLRDYQLMVQPTISPAKSQAFVIHPYDFNALPDLSALLGQTASLSIGTDTTWSDAAEASIPNVLSFTVNGVTYSTAYGLHPRLRFWDWIATGIAWIAPFIAFLAVVCLALVQGRRAIPRTSRGQTRSHWTDYAIVSYATWLAIGFIGGYLLRVRAGSVEFWLLLYGYAILPAMLATALATLERRRGLLLPQTLARTTVDYGTTLFSPSDVYRIGLAFAVTAAVELVIVLGIREALVAVLS